VAQLSTDYKGKRLGRPKRVFDRQRAVQLRQQGRSLQQIARELGVGLGTVVRALDGQKLSKILPEQTIPTA
jgi:DNA invertase Pin-like site-specific DNA recombinase